jgi:hypothetical protein
MEFQNFAPYRPIIPVGSAYRTGNWAATPAEVHEFLTTAMALNLDAVNFWEWSNTRKYVPEDWDVVRDFAWSREEDITEKYFEALNTHNPEILIDLYQESAIHVNAMRSVHGKQDLKGWYAQLLKILLPDAVFTRAGFLKNGNSRWFGWTATSRGGTVINGSDTFTVSGDRIAYHFTSFTIDRSSLGGSGAMAGG